MKTFARIAAGIVVFALGIGAAGLADAWRKGGNALPPQYEYLLESADGLWSQYKMADQKFFELENADAVSHAMRLADLQNQLADLHTQWMKTDAPDGLEVVDMKVGLALELQMAAIGAELVALMGEDPTYLELSAELDSEYETVVGDL